MSEFDKSSLEGFLIEEARKRAHIEDSIGVISQILDTSVRRIIDAYEAERQALLPEAQEKLTSVIIPWWQDFEESGAYQRVFEYLSQRDFGSGIDPVATLSEPIVFPWLRISTNLRDLERDACYIAELQKGDVEKAKEAAAKAYKPHDDWRNLWTAHFYVAGEDQFRHDPGFGISRWPITGGGFVYAMSASRNDIHLHRAEADQLITRVHPDVVIGFAEQIENGQVYKRLQASLQPRSPGSIRIISGDEYARSQGKLARRYLERKQTRSNN